MFTIQNRAEKKEKETKKANVSPYNPLLSKEINKKKEKNITWNIYILRLTSYINIYYILQQTADGLSSLAKCSQNVYNLPIDKPKEMCYNTRIRW